LEFQSQGSDDFSIRPDTTEDWKQVLAACKEDAPERLVVLSCLDAEKENKPWAGTENLLALRPLKTWAQAGSCAWI
jgi:hypothetical protein